MRGVETIKIFFQMMGIYGKMDLLWFLRDTKYCLLYIVTDIIAAAAGAAGVFTLLLKFGGFGGMNQNELLFMLGYGIIIEGLYMLFFGGGNMGVISRVIGRGQLDHNMIQPVPLWIQLLTAGFIPVSGSSIFLFGLSLMLFGIVRCNLPVSPLWMIRLILSLFSSLAVLVSVVYIISCCAFYSPAAAEEIAGTPKSMFSTLKSYPLGGLGKGWKTLLCLPIPVGISAWYPVMELLNKAEIQGFTAITAVVFILIAVLLFRKGMKYYGKYGSPRYSGFGHR